MGVVPYVLGAGRFEVRGTLGAGGAGIVYRVLDRELAREVALKHLRRASGRDLFRFKREFRALADIRHPNLVTLHELHAAGEDWFFTMELVEGVSFIDWVRPPRAATSPRTRSDIVQATLDEMRLRGALVQLVDALIALHQAGKLHRDLKPSNVLVTPNGRAALLDFGLVAAIAEANPERLAVGTPVYMSPEQASDQPLAEPSDWYGLGSMLYEALTGRRPFEGESEHVMTRKQTELPPDPRALAAKTPPDLARLCMQLLQPSPQARPTGVAILDRLGAKPSQRTRDIARSSSPANFVGRGRELAELARALADVRRRGVTVLVRARSGMGKTALVRRFVRSLDDQAFVLEGRCFEREQVPFKMLDGIVDMLTTLAMVLPADDVEAIAPKEMPALARLFPVMKRVTRFAELVAAGPPPPADPAELRRRGFSALRQLLARLARIRPVVIFVDDAHWGDADSAAFLAELVHAGELGTLVIVAHRPEDYLGMVAKLRNAPAGSSRRGDVRELEVAPLSDDDAIALVAQVATDSRRAEQVVRAGAGNPLVLTEMARTADLADGARIDDLVRVRAARLSPEAHAMLAVSAIAARPISIALAARAAGVVGGHDEAAQLASERLATIRSVDGQAILLPAHDHVRAAVIETLEVESRAGWHEALARAFEDVGGDAELDSQAIVEHWLAAGHPANAGHHAVAAAARAEDALAFRRAAELYAIALAYGPWDAVGQRDLLRKQARALASGGQLDEAAHAYARAAQLLPDDRDAIDCERARIEALLRRGHVEEALPAADHLLRQVGIKSPLGKGASRARLGALWVQQRLRGLDFAERDAAACKPADLARLDVLYSIVSGLAFADPGLGRALQAELLHLALDCGEPQRVALALAQEIMYAAGAGPRSANAVDAVGARLSALASRLGDPHLQGLANTAIGIAAYGCGRWSDARASLEAGLASLHAHGPAARWEIDIGESYWLGTLFYLGEWRDLFRNAQTLLRDALDRGDVVAQLGVRTGRGILGWLVAHRTSDARVQLAAAEQALAPGFSVPHVHAIQAACNVDLYAGEAAGGARRLAAAWSDIERVGALRVQLLRVELNALRTRLLVADRSRPRDERAKQVRVLADELLDEGVAWAAASGYLARAGAAALRDDVDGAFTALVAAEDELAKAGMVGVQLIARLRGAELEGGPGGAARAEAARDALRDLGAVDPDAVAALLVPWPT